MLGAIADDFTGATDLATMLRRSGHRVSVVIEDGSLSPEQLRSVDAVVIALKTRTAPRAEAVAASLDATARLRSWGVTRFYVKYCSTFDSTDDGNIGPVLDAVSDAVSGTAGTAGAPRAVVVPSLPANGRTVYNGHLFVGSDLLEHSSMRHHPLTPMTRSRVADLLRPQTTHDVAEVTLATVRQGADAVRRALDAVTADADADARYVVVDAITDEDLATIARATADDVLVSGGSGLALGIAGPGLPDVLWSPPAPSEIGRGRGAVLCGSVSTTTLAQIAHAARTQPVRLIDLDAAVSDEQGIVAELASWVEQQDAAACPVVCAARERDDVRSRLGDVEVAPVVERVLAGVAQVLVARGSVDALIVAGGESSGAVVRALGVEALHIGPELAPGVCWAAGSVEVSEHGSPESSTVNSAVALALKSGNFGGEDLFTQAWEVLR